MLRASKPAIRARPTSSASATSRGRSSPRPANAASPKAEHGVEVELAGAQLGIEPRRPARRPARYRPRRPSTVPRSNSVRSRSTAMRSAPSVTSPRDAPRLDLRRPAPAGRRARRPALFGIVGVDRCAAGEAQRPCRADRAARSSLTWVKPGRAELELVEPPGRAVRAQLAADALQHARRRASPRRRSTASCTGHGGRSAPPSISPNACIGGKRQAPRRVGRGEQPVEIDLARRQRALQLRAARRT